MTSLIFRKNSYIIFPLILLLVYSALIPMQLSDYVLCFGEDGHVKIEYAAHGCCADVPSHDLDHTETTTTEDEDHCGECVDLPIFATINTEIYNVYGKDDTPTNSTISSVIQISPTIIFPSNPNINSCLVTPPFIDQTILSLRTVTLLI